MRKKLLKIAIFLGIFVMLFNVVQDIMTPKYYYPDTTVAEATSRVYRGFLDEEEASLEVIFAGSSHITYSVSPITLYEDYGFTSYNLASPGQPLAVTRYALQTAIKTQQPKVFVLDVSTLFRETYNGASYKYVTEQVPFSMEKLQLIQQMSELSENEDDIISGLFPIIDYHSRWKELDENDFTYMLDNDHFFVKGYYLNARRIASNIDVAYMNYEAQQMIEDDTKVTYTWQNQQFSETEEADELYVAKVSEYNLQMLLEIADICEENNIELLLVKIPVVTSPTTYKSAWTEARSNLVKEIAEKYQLKFLDLVYDIDCGIDWSTDSADGGGHLNTLGAEKITDIIGQYLLDNYNIPQRQYETWDKDAELYDDLKRVAMLELENDFYEYMYMLKEKYADKTVFIACTNEMSAGLSEEEIALLRSMGFNADYENGYRQSYIAIMENGKVTYEQMSNRIITKNGTIGDSVKYWLCSAGHYVGNKSYIKIDGESVGTSSIGLNIVVYDQEKNIVLDAVNFNTFSEEHGCIRDYSLVDRAYLRQYEDYLINCVE